MRAYRRMTTYPLLLVFISVLFLSSTGTCQADGFFSRENIPKLIGTIAGAALGVVLVSTALPSFGVLGMVGGGLVGAILGRYITQFITGERDFDSVSDLTRDAWDETKSRAHDVGWWFRDRYDNVKDYFDDKFGKPGIPAANPSRPVDDDDLGTLRAAFLEATIALQKAVSSRDPKAQQVAREQYEEAYQRYFTARGAVIGK